MNSMASVFLRGLLFLALVIGAGYERSQGGRQERQGRLLYVAAPGIRNYVEFGGVGVLVFDMDDGHRFVRRIPTFDHSPPENVKGICASAKTGRLYVSTIRRLACIDLRTDMMIWNREYEGGCDRMSITPDGSAIYLPSLEKDHWNVLSGETGDVIAKIEPKSGAHNTIVGLDGKRAYLAGLRSPLLPVVDTRANQIVKSVGPFSNSIRPFTINRRQNLVFVNVNELLGFEVGDVDSGKMLLRVEVSGYQKGPIKRHGCPSHGVGLTPDESEVWVCDAANQAVHIFDATVMPPRQKESVKLREQPGWITFSLDGKWAYPSTGEVVDVKSKRILTTLTDETGREVHSEKMIELHFQGGRPIRNGDQFGLGRKR